MIASSKPDAVSEAVQRQRRAVEIVRDVAAGTLRMRERASAYLPAFPLEHAADYSRRVANATLYNCVRRTVEGLAGLIMREDPILGQDVPPEIAEHLETVDGGRMHFAPFALEVVTAALLDGHAHILVDHPTVDPDVVRTRFDEQRLGVRPYWCMVSKPSVLRFRHARIGGREELVAFAFEQRSAEADGEFGEVEVRRVYDYRLDIGEGGERTVRFSVWREVKTEWSFERGGALGGVDRIPVVTVYGGRRLGPMETEPALLDLALENVHHFKARSDLSTLLHICGVPVFVTTGAPLDGNVIAVGPNSALTLPQNADAKYVEPTASGLAEMRLELHDIEGRMAALGLALLARETHAAETAEAKRIDKSQSDSALSRVARSLQDAMEEALSLHATWLGLADGGSVTVNRAFEKVLLDASQLAELRTMVAEEVLSVDTLWDLLQHGGVLPEGFDRDRERARLAGDRARKPPLLPSLRAVPATPTMPPAPAAAK